MAYFLTTSFYDAESETEEFSDSDDAWQAYHDSCAQRDDLGQAFGDVSHFRLWKKTGSNSETLARRGYP